MKFLSAFLIASSALFSQVIQGTVLNSVTETPLGGVSVRVAAAGGASYQATTDDQGAFRIDGVKDGQYTATFSKSEFLTPTKDAARRSFRVATGSDPVRLQARLTPLSRVSGRVSDPEDHPVPGAVLLLDGSSSGLTNTSDKQGGFSFVAPPGSYLLSVRPPSELKPPASTDGERLGWVDMYYPGVLDPRAAVKLVVRAGSDLFGQDIRLRAAPVRRLRGMVIDTRGDPAPHVPIKAALAGEMLGDEIHVVSADDGSFEFPALHDGEWTVSAEMQAGEAKVRAFSVAQVAGRDYDRLELHLAVPFTLHGSVSFGGAAGPKDKRVGLLLRPSVVGSDKLNQGATEQDGSFKIENVYPGLYKIVAFPPGPPHFLASVTMGDREVLGQYVEFSASVPIRITFDSKGGGVRGTVEDCGSATVVLVSQDRLLQDPQFVYTARCQETGRYELPNIRPGDYYAFAFDPWDGPMELISSFDPTLANKAASVRVARGEVATVDLRVTTLQP